MSDDAEIRFESALSELETLVDDLQRGEPALDAALAKYQKGLELLGRCYGMLERAERSVAVLSGIREDGEVILSPFDPTATIDLARTAAATIIAQTPVEAAEAPTPKPKRRRTAKATEEPAPAPAPPAVEPEAAAEPEYDRFDPPF